MNKRTPLLLCIFLGTLASAQAPSTRPAITPDRETARYRQGETITFTVTSQAPASRPLTYKITKDGFGKPISQGPLTDLPAVLTAKLDEPGFVRLELLTPDNAIASVATAAVDPEQIKPSLPPPDDFDAFWASQKQLLRDESAKPVLTAVESPDKSVDAFDLQMDCPGGAPLSAYVAKPKDAKPKSLPAILFPHSAGVRSSQLNVAVHGAAMGCLAVDFNAHGIPNGKPAEFYTELLNGDLKGYSARGRESRETSYFRGMILRLLRAIEFATTQPEWDGKTLIVYGSSQGGGQALIAAGLDDRVTLCLASVPALCDHTGFAADRIPGWPKLAPRTPDWTYPNKEINEASRYVDAMNFAKNIRAETIVTVGYIDHVCPPSSVYAAYNAIPATKKQIIPVLTMGHEFPANLRKVFDEAVKAHVAERQQK